MDQPLHPTTSPVTHSLLHPGILSCLALLGHTAAEGQQGGATLSTEPGLPPALPTSLQGPGRWAQLSLSRATAPWLLPTGSRPASSTLWGHAAWASSVWQVSGGPCLPQWVCGLGGPWAPVGLSELWGVCEAWGPAYATLPPFPVLPFGAWHLLAGPSPCPPTCHARSAQSLL